MPLTRNILTTDSVHGSTGRHAWLHTSTATFDLHGHEEPPRWLGLVAQDQLEAKTSLDSDGIKLGVLSAHSNQHSQKKRTHLSYTQLHSPSLTAWTSQSSNTRPNASRSEKGTTGTRSEFDSNICTHSYALKSPTCLLSIVTRNPTQQPPRQQRRRQQRPRPRASSDPPRHSGRSA